MDIFINKEKRQYVTLEIYFYCYNYNDLTDGNDNMVFSHNKNSIPADSSKIKKLVAKILAPTFDEYMGILRDSVLQLSNGGALIDEASYRENIVKTLLKKIITDDYEYEITEDNYGELHPLLGVSIYRAFDEKFLNPVLNTNPHYTEEEK